MSFSTLKLTNQSNIEESSTIDNKFLSNNISKDIYLEMLEFISEEQNSLTDEQINIYRGILSEEVINEKLAIISKVKKTLSKLTGKIKDTSKQVEAKVKKKPKDNKKETKKTKDSITECLDNGLIINDLSKVNPSVITSETSVGELKESYMEQFRIYNETSNISDISDFNNKIDSIVKAIDKVSFNESGSIYGFEPFSSLSETSLLVESVGIFVACLCEAVEQNYIALEENNFYNSENSDFITEGFFSKGNYNYKFYNKNSSDNITERLKRNRQLLSTVDKFTDINTELKYINRSLPKLKKTLAEMKIDYEDFCSLSKEEQITQSRFIDISEKSLYAISNITGMVSGIRLIEDKPDKLDVDRIKSNARYNIHETERCIKYMEKRKKQIEKQKMKDKKGGKNK